MINQTTVIQLSNNLIKMLTGFVNRDDVSVVLAQQMKIQNLDDLKNDPSIFDNFLKHAKDTFKGDFGPFIILYPPMGFTSVSVSEDAVINKSGGETLQISDYQSCYRRGLKKGNQKTDKKSIYCVPYKFVIDDGNELNDFAPNITTESFCVDMDVEMIDKLTFKDYQTIIENLPYKPKLEMVSTYPISLYLQTKEKVKEYITLEMEEDFSYLSYFNENRLVSSYILKTSVNSILNQSLTKLKCDYDRAKLLFAIANPGSIDNVDYQTKENLSIEDISNVFYKKYEDVAKEISSLLQGIDKNVEIFLYGDREIINSSYFYLSRYIENKIKIYDPVIIGSGDGSYLDCISTILVSALPYQFTSSQNRKKTEEYHLSRIDFSR